MPPDLYRTRPRPPINAPSESRPASTTSVDPTLSTRPFASLRRSSVAADTTDKDKFGFLQ